MGRDQYRPYPASKDSGVEWLGEIPAHWEALRLKHLATVNDEALPETTDPSMEIAYVELPQSRGTHQTLTKCSRSDPIAGLD